MKTKDKNVKTRIQLQISSELEPIENINDVIGKAHLFEVVNWSGRNEQLRTFSGGDGKMTLKKKLEEWQKVKKQIAELYKKKMAIEKTIVDEMENIDPETYERKKRN